jgi:hypothetical protein
MRFFKYYIPSLLILFAGCGRNGPENQLPPEKLGVAYAELLYLQQGGAGSAQNTLDSLGISREQYARSVEATRGDPRMWQEMLTAAVHHLEMRMERDGYRKGEKPPTSLHPQ